MTRSVVSLDDLTVNNVGTFKKITDVVLPTSYPQQWYKDSIDHIVKLAYFSELPVGAIKAKAINFSGQTRENIALLPPQGLDTPKILPNALYIELLAVLAAYRGQGVGSALLQYVLSEAKKRFIHEVVLHVSVDNKNAIEWYVKMGFVKGDVVKDYYKEQGLENPDAVIMRTLV